MAGWSRCAGGRVTEAAARPSVHFSIDVPELEAGVLFYTRVFGFVEKARPFATMAVLDAGNATVCIHEKRAGSSPSPGNVDARRYTRHWTPVHLDVHVPDVDAVVRQVIALGGHVEQSFDRPKPTAFCADPFGNGFCVLTAR